MGRAMFCWLALMLLAGAAGAQEITIDIEDVPLAEAVKLLSNLSGVAVRGKRDAVEHAPRVTAKFDRTPLKEVVRELCRQAGWHVDPRWPSQYLLSPGPGRDERPRCRVGKYEVILDRLRLHRGRGIDLRRREPRVESGEGVSFDITVEAATEEDMVAMGGVGGEARLVCADGTTLELRQTLAFSDNEPHQHREGIYSSRKGLPPGGPATLEGELTMWAKVERAETEFSLDEVGATKELGRMKVTFVGVEEHMEGGAPLARFELLLPDGPMVRLRKGVSEWWASSIRPHARLLIDRADGSRDRQWSMARWMEPQEGLARFRHTFFLGHGDEPEPVKLTYTVIVARDATERAPFRIEGVVLPTVPGWDER